MVKVMGTSWKWALTTGFIESTKTLTQKAQWFVGSIGWPLNFLVIAIMLSTGKGRQMFSEVHALAQAAAGTMTDPLKAPLGPDGIDFGSKAGEA
jgi:hypothetical protein